MWHKRCVIAYVLFLALYTSPPEPPKAPPRCSRHLHPAPARAPITPPSPNMSTDAEASHADVRGTVHKLQETRSFAVPMGYADNPTDFARCAGGTGDTVPHRYPRCLRAPVAPNTLHALNWKKIHSLTANCVISLLLLPIQHLCIRRRRGPRGRAPCAAPTPTQRPRPIQRPPFSHRRRDHNQPLHLSCIASEVHISFSDASPSLRLSPGHARSRLTSRPTSPPLPLPFCPCSCHSTAATKIRISVSRALPTPLHWACCVLA